MRRKKYTQKVKIENNHRFSGMTCVNFVTILLLIFIYSPESKAYTPPLSVKTGSVICMGESNGSIEIVPTDEIPESFTVEVRSDITGLLGTFNENSSIPFQMNNLNAGDYTIWYSNGIKKDRISVEIESPEILNANVISIVSISGENDAFRASIRANPTGGTPPYSISWSENTNNQDGAVASDLPMGVYRCTINDANFCGEVTATIFLYEHEIEKYKNETSK